MAGTTAAAPMDADAAAVRPATKGKATLSAAAAVKSSPWVEKYRPQSLADVAAHRDIVDTIIEKYTRSTRFALICNHVNKIIPALQSRCTRFRFAPLDGTNVSERLQHVIKSEGLDVDKGGLTALVRLSNGDMRKALNILQSTHMASPQITEEAVYLCTGNPMPKDIEQIASWLLNEPFSTSFKYISDTKMRKGLALIDIIREVTMFVFKINMPSNVRVKLINDLADIEYRLTFACNNKLQLGALISTFTTARAAMVAAAA
ncbi:replication factor C subunit 3-like [Triticum dicoccoides]|uniref:replication factor C subunit 3-like n=1 Tax=Triticum dicoccoides TaxID=85692 RepID=UPI00084526E8|nr:replication factor C subunit 3-like [Triticum dicoccoides]XP_044320425.1 replication factor C subunit 3-like [Triticum aestivum]